LSKIELSELITAAELMLNNNTDQKAIRELLANLYICKAIEEYLLAGKYSDRKEAADYT